MQVSSWILPPSRARCTWSAAAPQQGCAEKSLSWRLSGRDMRFEKQRDYGGFA
jgi:hypothetical protein